MVMCETVDAFHCSKLFVTIPRPARNLLNPALLVFIYAGREEPAIYRDKSLAYPYPVPKTTRQNGLYVHKPYMRDKHKHYS